MTKMGANSATTPDRGDVPEFTMGDRIRKARRHSDRTVSQVELASAITLAGWRVSPQAVGNWESGLSDISPKRRELVATATALITRVNKRWILTGMADDAPPAPAGGEGVGPAGLEPATYGLKVRSFARVISIDWARQRRALAMRAGDDGSGRVA